MTMNQIMQIFHNRTFKSFDDRESAAVFSDIEFRECHFDNCAISMTHEPALRSTVRNISLIDCEVSACWIRAAVVEDMLVENLKTPGFLHTFGAVFKHVVLRGRFDRLMIANYVLPRSDVNAP